MANAETGQRRLRASAVIPASLTFENVTRRFEGKEAVSDVSFTAGNGEVICLLGASGCGKSTLLRLAAGIEVPDSGRILLDGKEIAGPKTFVEPEDRGIGLVFQDYALFPHLDALSNARFGLGDLAKRESLSIADAALRRVGLGDRLRAMPHELSGGEQQRVALARAVVPRPRVLLMDEPFSNLDRRMRDQVREETVAVLRETGATALIVTHDPEEAMRIADRIALMRAGKLIQIGASRDIYNNPVDLEAARFFCDLNEIEATVKNGRIETALGTFPAPGKQDGERAIAAIRPQSIRLKPAGFCLSGRIISHRFIGEVDLVEVAVQGLDRTLRARVQDAPATKPGSDIGVDIKAAEVLVF
ncbi:MAG: iron ABC transporter ATP-binding protein [Rhizobiales bacterium PAR1]|nr:MAG: iron ABC transporter ATP-binding protein [Rhizobiales bacterium PAR1]